MKPVESYSAINTRLDRPSVQEGTARKVGGPVANQNTENAKAEPAIMTTASLLAAKTPPFDSHKVAEVRQKIAAGIYDVDTAALAKKMLDMGVFGTESDK
ncbi:MAG: flagellar biosynthesis anti-sigma factor FlgM [Sphingorhabdus sp.]|jgi:flagellar biosynthesis anti-sigma factor FlgM|nr:flagellar biosynthesis anti-sigma factor FlgM [Sphingorhabdus sp.]